MKTFMQCLFAFVFVVGCEDRIGPDPTSGTGAASQGGGGSGGDGAGANGDGGSEQGTSGSRIKAVTLVGEDGSRVPNGWHDSELQLPCSWRRAADDKTRCLPADFETVSRYSDASCSVPILEIMDGACAPKAYAIDFVKSCASPGQVPDAHVFTTQGTTSPGMVYRFNDFGACTSGSPSTTATYYLTAEMAASSFVAATEETAP